MLFLLFQGSAEFSFTLPSLTHGITAVTSCGDTIGDYLTHNIPIIEATESCPQIEWQDDSFTHQNIQYDISL